MKFYAHTAEDDQGNHLPEEKWQPLSEHLRNVADLAKNLQGCSSSPSKLNRPACCIILGNRTSEHYEIASRPT
jgi:hypothetical protein